MRLLKLLFKNTSRNGNLILNVFILLQSVYFRNNNLLVTTVYLLMTFRHFRLEKSRQFIFGRIRTINHFSNEEYQ